MIGPELISLTLIFFFVIVGAIIATRFKQPVAIGLLIIGAIIGPNALNLIKDQQIVGVAVEIGTILLLFTIGLEFVIPKLVKIGFKAILLGILKIGIVFFLSYQAGILFGLEPLVAMITGFLISVSSTVVIVKVLEAKKLYRREEMPLLIGMLLIEDIFAVVLLAFMNKMAANGSGIGLLQNIVIGITILGFAYLLMLRLSKSIVTWFIRNSHEEVVAYIALALCLGFSYLAYFLGLSPAIGAFLAGSIVASLPSVKLFEKAIWPYTEIFTSLFFIAMGMMVSFSSLRTYLWLIVMLLVLVVISRFIAVGVISYLFASFKKEQVIFSSMAMLAVGEFSLLIAQSAMKFNLGIDFVSIVAFLILATAVLMSFSISHYDKVVDLLETAPKWNWTDKPKSFSNYVKLLFSELDVESSFTKKFKKMAKQVVLSLLIIFLSFVAWSELLVKFQEWALGVQYTYMLHAGFALITLVFLYMIYLDGKVMKQKLTEVLADHDSCNMRRSSFILKNLLLIIALFVIAIYSPLLFVAFNLSPWFNVIPFALLAFVVARLKGVIRVMPDLRRETTTISFSQAVRMRAYRKL